MPNGDYRGVDAIERGVDAIELACLARQPIFTSELNVCGYELLYRAAPSARGSGLFTPSPAEETAASAATLMAALTDIGLDAIVGHRTAWVNVGGALLLNDLASVLPPERVVLEVLETVAVSPEVVDALAALRRAGYRIALDDVVFRPGLEPLLELADVVKVDVVGGDWDAIERQAAWLGRYPAALLAEKVETHEALQRCRELGFTLFQGNVLSTPRLVASRRASTDCAVRAQLAARLNDPEVGIAELAGLIEADVTLSYRLLRYVNSAHAGLSEPVSSIRQALVLVGLRRVRSWATLLVLSDTGPGRRELVVTALLRAEMCERLARGVGVAPGEAFLAGLLSAVDALVDLPLAEALDEVPIPDRLRVALLKHEGQLGDLLERVLAYERGDFAAATRPPLDAATLTRAYLSATAWALQLPADTWAAPA